MKKMRRPYLKGRILAYFAVMVVALLVAATTTSLAKSTNRAFAVRPRRRTSPAFYPRHDKTSVPSFLSSIRGGGDRRGYQYNNGENDEDYDHSRTDRRRDDDAYYGQQRQDRRYYGEDRDGYYEDEQRYYERDYYDDRGQTSGSGRGRYSDNGSSSLSSNLPTALRKGDRKIGFMLLSSGAVVTLLGFSMFMNKTLLRLGNLLFIAGVPMTIGPGRTAGYFFQPRKARSTACLALGILLVFMKHPIIGICLELFGLLNLFGNMFPVAFAVAKSLPIIGPILKSTSGNGNKQNKKRYNEDPYYGDQNYDDRDRERDSAERYY